MRKSSRIQNAKPFASYSTKSLSAWIPSKNLLAQEPTSVHAALSPLKYSFLSHHYLHLSLALWKTQFSLFHWERKFRLWQPLHVNFGVIVSTQDRAQESHHSRSRHGLGSSYLWCLLFGARTELWLHQCPTVWCNLWCVLLLWFSEASHGL